MWRWRTVRHGMTPACWQASTRDVSRTVLSKETVFSKEVVSRGSERFMAMTGVVKDELSRVPVVKPCCRKAEVSTLLRFAGGLHLVEGRVVIEAELDTGAAARRLRAAITEVF